MAQVAINGVKFLLSVIIAFLSLSILYARLNLCNFRHFRKRTPFSQFINTRKSHSQYTYRKQLISTPHDDDLTHWITSKRRSLKSIFKRWLTSKPQEQLTSQTITELPHLIYYDMSYFGRLAEWFSAVCISLLGQKMMGDTGFNYNLLCPLQTTVVNMFPLPQCRR